MNSATSPMVNSRAVAGIILAAGKGTRMRSATPKVLHKLAGRTMLDWVFAALHNAGIEQKCVVLSDQSEDLTGFEDFLKLHAELCVTTQKNRLGTGDATASAAFGFAGVAPPAYAAGRLLQGKPLEKPKAKHILITAGDIPAIEAKTLATFIDESLKTKAALSVLGMRVPNPTGYGRLVTKGDELLEIVEEKDADAATKAIDLCNTGVIFAESDLLFELLRQLKADNAQREYYLTDCFKLARLRRCRTHVHTAADWRDFAGINDRQQLAEVEAYLVQRKIKELQQAGVSFHLPASTYVEVDVQAGHDCVIGASATLCGRTILGQGVSIGANAHLDRVEVGDSAVIGEGSVLKNCVVSTGDYLPPLSLRLES